MKHLRMTAEFVDEKMQPAPGALGARTIRVGRNEPELITLRDNPPRFSFADGAEATVYAAAAAWGGPARAWASVAAYLASGDAAQLTPEARACHAAARLELPTMPWQFGERATRRWRHELAGAAGWNRWVIVRIRETEHWCADVRALATEVWGVYAYDELLAEHLAEVTPSHGLHRLGALIEGPVLPEEDGERLDELIRDGESDDGFVYMHCRDLERLPASRKHLVGFLPPKVDVREELGDASDWDHVWAWNAERTRLVEPEGR